MAEAVKPDAERLGWISSNLHILTKDGRRVLLSPNGVQLRLHLSMQAQRLRGLPVRIRLLKARQFGCSTWTEADGFFEVYHRPNWNAMAVSVDAESTDHIFRMTRLFEEDMPGELRRPKDNTNRKEIVFSKPHRSRFLSQTAGKLSLGRSFTAQYLHCSEFAFWENAATQMSGLEDIVPLKAGTTIVQETTANGQGGAFYEGWVEDVKRRRRHPEDYGGYLPVFFPWFIFPDYAIDPPFGTVFDKTERALQKRFDLSDSQLYWRRLKIASKNGDVALFMQEFPATWQEAFQTSGNPVFSGEIIATQALYQQERFRQVLFTETTGHVEAVDTDESHNSWLLWQEPQDGHDYVVGIDSMEGRLSDVNNPKSDLDWDAMVVLDRNTGEFVAMYHGRTDQRALGRQAFRAAVWYNEAYVAPEIPAGMVLLSYFKERGYAWLYNRARHEDHMTDGESETLGWRTTAITRKYLIDDFVVAAKEASVRAVFPDLLDEMRAFVRNKNGRPEAMAGEHDDLVFAAAIALQAHKRCPLTTRPYAAGHTGEDLGRHEEHSDDDLAYAGAVDPGIEDEDEDEEQEYTI